MRAAIGCARRRVTRAGPGPPQDFGPSFVELARSVYHNNDERGRLKRLLNQQTKSLLVEEKLYTHY